MMALSNPIRALSCLQLLFVDGNGLLHYNGFGLACHLGVLSDIPTIGLFLSLNGGGVY